MASATPAGGHDVVHGLFGDGRGGARDLSFWTRDGRGGMALCHSFLVDAGDGFFEEGGAGNGGWYPDGIATRMGVGKGSGCR